MTPLSKLAVLAGLLGAGVLGLVTPTPAAAQGALMGNSPWGFSQGASRASIAALIESKQSSSSSSSASSAAGGSGAEGSFCGGSGGTAAATANYTCIILEENATASINLGQTSAGGQSAQSQTATGGTSFSTLPSGDPAATGGGGNEPSLSDVLEGMSNH
ncbi:MAG: hypothetical protein Q8P46_02960 [Hyphomicrobiales bacterium]|nr:hypothetical protein [Hyphomicrobiales bacterium]